MIDPPRWTQEELERERVRAIEVFRKERLEEPVEVYSEKFDEYQGKIEELLEATVDLTKLDSETSTEVLANKALFQAFRYISGPPISKDDLKTITDAVSLSPKKLRANPDVVERIVRVLLDCIDRRRFPWVTEEREPSESERNAAILASAALMAYQVVQTTRRNEGKGAQEEAVKGALIGAKFNEVPRREVGTVGDAPKPGEFCPESKLGTRKADFIVGLWDRRILPIECKVSNSALNSVKRLNNDAAVKATSWIRDFGERNVVPVAVLSGVYKLSNPGLWTRGGGGRIPTAGVP